MSPIVQIFEASVPSRWFCLGKGGLRWYSLNGGGISLGAGFEIKRPSELPVHPFCLVPVVQDLSS